MTLRSHFLHFAVALLCLGRVMAQSVDDLVITTALSTNGTDGQPWIYVVWDSSTGVPLVGRSFSINLKPGTADSGASFVRQAVVTSSVSATELPPTAIPPPAVTRSLVTKAICLGENLNQLDVLLADALTGLQSPAPALPATREERLSALIGRGETGTQRVTLPILRRISPAVSMSLGQAWAGRANVAAGAPVTVEVRECSPRSAIDRGVVGRITINAASYTPLPAAGAVVPVPDTTNTGDLNLKIRWSMPDSLLRRQAQLQGFHIWRATQEEAQANGWLAATPTLTQLENASLASPELVKRRTTIPLREAKIFSAANVNPATGGDSTTFFYSDDNDRYRPGGVPFQDGDVYHYYVVSYDLLGRAGGVSPAGDGAMALRIFPPPAPKDVRVTERTNEVLTGPNAAATELQISWLPNDNSGLDVTTYYEVFEAVSASAYDPNSTTPPTLIGTVQASSPTVGNLSRANPAPGTDGTVRWYSVRAVQNRHAGVRASAYSPPVPGVFRRFTPAIAPAAADTFASTFCQRTTLIKTSATNLVRGSSTPPAMVRLVIQKEHSDLAYVDISELFLFFGYVPKERLFFDPGATSLTYEFQSQPPFLGSGPATQPAYDISVTAVSKGGVRSLPLVLQTESNPQSNHLVVISLRASVLGASDFLVAPTVLSSPLIGSVTGLSPVTSTPSATVGVTQRMASIPAPLPQEGDFLIYRVYGEFDFTPHAVVHGRLGKVFFPPASTGSPNYFISQILGDTTACAANFHHPRPASGLIVPVTVGFAATNGMREYRLYRQVDTGELTLVKHGEINVPVGTRLSYDDFGLPPNSACLTYFVQTFDKDGNSSPMQRLGQCVQSVVPLKAPLMGQPEFLGTAAAPKVRLRWTAETEGVERFEIMADPDDGGFSSGATITSLGPRSTFTRRSAAESLAGLPVFNVGRLPTKERATGGTETRPFAHGRAFLTPFIGTGPSSIGTGPGFTAEFDVTPGVEYHFVVSALGRSTGAVQSRSDFSNQITFRWTPPPPPPSADCVLPWPAKDLPPVTAFNTNIAARAFASNGVAVGTNERSLWPLNHDNYPVGIRIGSIKAYTLGTIAGYSTPATTDDVMDFTPSFFYDASFLTLDAYVFTGGAQAIGVGQSLLPAVLYRQQIPNSAFPVVPDIVVQCSPMITHISFEGAGSNQKRLRDPYIGVTAPSTFVTSWLPDIRTGVPGDEFPPPMDFSLDLLDTKPVLAGAKYQYSLLRFGSAGEPVEIINAGQIEIPSL